MKCVWRKYGYLATLGLLPLLACSELNARNHARKGNHLYQAGEYWAAVEEYDRAEALYPGLVPVALNKGLACRQLMVPGAKGREQRQAVDCALAAFARLARLQPKNPRGHELYIQTLFDAERFARLESMYLEKLKKNPKDLASINALIQVYSRSNRWRSALDWTVKRAQRQPSDAQAQYAVGVFIYNELAQRGGSGDNASFDPRPGAPSDQPSPSFGNDDLVNEERVKLADQGIEYLKRALSLRKNFAEALTYINLLYRQKAIAFFTAPDQWQAAIEQADFWRRKAVEAGRAGQN